MGMGMHVNKVYPALFNLLYVVKLNWYIFTGTNEKQNSKNCYHNYLWKFWMLRAKKVGFAAFPKKKNKKERKKVGVLLWTI